MKEYVIRSRFTEGDEVCLRGDGQPSTVFGIVLGFARELNNNYVSVSFSGGPMHHFSEVQLELREDRVIQELTGN